MLIPEPDPTLEAKKERGWGEVAAIEAAFTRGDIDADGWHRAMAELIVPAYLMAESPRAQSGSDSDEEGWKQARSLILEALDRDGTFLDIGCANGHLMETLTVWADERGIHLDPYGLDISPELAEFARRRLPIWSERIFVGNALGWIPPMQYTYVRTGLEYVPATLRPQLIKHLLSHVVEPGGRLIIGMFTEEKDRPNTEEALKCWGFTIAGKYERTHLEDERLVRRVVWIDRVI